MTKNLRALENTIVELETQIGDQIIEIDDLFIWLEKYIRSVFISKSVKKKGEELTVPLDAAFNISIRLFQMIDSGEDGVDDKLAEELVKIKTKYLGS